MHHILCVVVILEEERNEEGGEERKRREVAIKKFSDQQNIAKLKIYKWCLSSWLTQNDENDYDSSGYEGRFPTMVKV